MVTDSTQSDPWGPPTRWTLIQRAARAEMDDETHRAFNDLVRRYETPVRQSVELQMRGHPSAAEVADSFFGYLFEQRLLPRVDRDQGRFRCYMQGVIRLYVRNWKRRTARTASDIEELDLPAGDDAAIESDEESSWASSVLANAIARFTTDNPEYAELVLRRYGIAPFAPETPEELAARTGRSKGAINVAVHRGRERLKEAVLEEVRELSGSTRDFERESELLIQRILDAHPTLLAVAGNATT